VGLQVLEQCINGNRRACDSYYSPNVPAETDPGIGHGWGYAQDHVLSLRW